MSQSAFFGNHARVSTNRVDGDGPDVGASYTGGAKTTGGAGLDKIKNIAKKALQPDAKTIGENIADSHDVAGVLIFDNKDHSGDLGGEPIAGRGSADEAANLYREFDALGYEPKTTMAIDADTLSEHLNDVAVLVLPEAEGGDAFPDKNTVADFVNDGGNLLVFGGSGADAGGPQLKFINETFGLELTGSYAGSGVYPLKPDALVEFLDGPESLGSNNGTSYLDKNFLPENSVEIYGRDGDGQTVLVFMPQGNGQLVFLGWDFYDSFSQDDGWDEVFATVAELTGLREVAGLSSPDIGDSLFA